jgi:hypothetical protein
VRWKDGFGEVISCLERLKPLAVIKEAVKDAVSEHKFNLGDDHQDNTGDAEPTFIVAPLRHACV